MGRILIDGNEAIAYGAIKAGCRFFAGYPITPATSIYSTMLSLLPPAGGICLQGEDEIASIGCCLGASMAGWKAMTATSGPGISLYSEQISFAIAGEIPIVIVDVQRLGPSTGSATRGADGDIQFLRWGSSGGLPVIVLAPIDAADCFLLTMHAFNLAETYRCPVFIASNKEIGLTKESLDIHALQLPAVMDRKAPPTAEGDAAAYLPFAPLQGEQVPGFAPIGGKILSRQTSSTHGPDGYITTDPGIIAETQHRLREKIENAVQNFSFHEYFPAQGARTLIIAYGVTARAANAVCDQRKNSKDPISLLILKTLWPVPEGLIRKIAGNYDRILVPEMNLGQYVREIERILPEKRPENRSKNRISFIGEMNGKLIGPEEIREALDRKGGEG